MLWLLIALGGALGAMGRYAMIQFMPVNPEHFPWAIWLANVLGSLLIGVFYVVIIEKGLLAPTWRPLLMVGFLGALTTFSTFALDAVLLWQHGQSTMAFIYVITSVVACILAASVSITLMRHLLP